MKSLRNTISVFLCMLFMAVISVKSLHSVERDCSENFKKEQKSSDEHHKEDCSVCKFFFNQFTTSDAFEIALYQPQIELPLIQTIVSEFIPQQSVTLSLRAPPIV